MGRSLLSLRSFSMFTPQGHYDLAYVIDSDVLGWGAGSGVSDIQDDT